jgi:hypothetical protein
MKQCVHSSKKEAYHMSTPSAKTMYNVTSEQLNACFRVIDETTGEVLYRVQSAHTDEEYTVRFVPDIQGRGHITCTCRAGQNGIACWHIRAAVAHDALQSKELGTMSTTDERTLALSSYRARDHLIKIKSKDGSLRSYLPAAWRLYELSLRYPDANFSTELLFFDLEKNFCIVRCKLYLGADYEFSTKKVEACKSGLLTNLDRIETAAQARCARLFGIGTEHALESDEGSEEEEPAVAPAAAQTEKNSEAKLQNNLVTLAALKKAVLSAGLAHNREEWAAWKRAQLGQDVEDDTLTREQIAHLYTRAGAAHVKPLQSVS